MAHMRAFGQFLLDVARLSVHHRTFFDDKVFLRAAYRAFLRREPSTDECERHVQALGGSLSRSAVLRSIIESREYELLHAHPFLLTELRRREVTHAVRRLADLGFSIAVDTRDVGIGVPLLMSGRYEEHVTQVLLRYLKGDTHFVDIGANIGYYSLLVASRCPEGQVYSFEPDRQSFALLEMSVALNRFERIIHAYNCAVSDEAGRIVFSDLGNATNSGARFTAKTEESMRPLVHGLCPHFGEVDAVALDSFLGQKRVDIVKIDVEGYEPFALRGMAGLIERNKPRILAEFAPGNLVGLGNTQPEEFLRFFVERGYELGVVVHKGRVVPFGQDVHGLIAYHDAQDAHHSDLLILPKGHGQ